MDIKQSKKVLILLEIISKLLQRYKMFFFSIKSHTATQHYTNEIKVSYICERTAFISLFFYMSAL